MKIMEDNTAQSFPYCNFIKDLDGAVYFDEPTGDFYVLELQRLQV